MTAGSRFFAGRWHETREVATLFAPARSKAMHYPKHYSTTTRRRKLGFLARMKTRLGRKMINRKRRMGRQLTPV